MHPGGCGILLTIQLPFKSAVREGRESMFPHLTADIIEDSILHLSQDLLGILLFDHSTQKNIIWATDDYIRQHDESLIGEDSHD